MKIILLVLILTTILLAYDNPLIGKWYSGDDYVQFNSDNMMEVAIAGDTTVCEYHITIYNRIVRLYTVDPLTPGKWHKMALLIIISDTLYSAAAIDGRFPSDFNGDVVILTKEK